MAKIVDTSTQPALGAIRLAWWREALERLDVAAPPAEPHLQAIARELLQRGVTRTTLAGIPDGWAPLLDEDPNPDAVAARGSAIFAAGACLLGASDERLLEAGALFAIAGAKRRGLGSFDFGRRSMRFPGKLRPLTALAALAARDLCRTEIEPEATPGRALALIRHRLSGIVARTD